MIKAGQKIGVKIGQTRPAQALVSAVKKVTGDRCSFTGDTPVLMGDGTTKPIQDIKPGDKVTSTDPETGERQSKTVEARWVHDDIVMTLEIDGNEIRTTEDHPFRSETDQTFERADQLEVGEKVLTGDGQLATVTAPIAPATSAYLPAFNLTVEGWHTYHVFTDGDRGPPDAALVHNCGGSTQGHSSRCECAAGGDPVIKRGPKPQGTGPHNLKIEEMGAQVADGQVVAGGGILPERAIPTPGGFKTQRRPDVLVERSDGSLYGINVGKQSPSGAPIRREAEAIQDLEMAGLPMHFVAYNP